MRITSRLVLQHNARVNRAAEVDVEYGVGVARRSG